MIRAFIVAAVGDLALFGLAYYWLGLRTSSTANVLLSAALALLLAGLAAYLIAFAFNRDAKQSLARIPATLAWLALLGLALAIFSLAYGWSQDIGLWLASALTLATRLPISPDTVKTLCGAVVLLVGLVMLMASWLPVAARIAHSGFEGLRDWRPVPIGLSYLATTALYLALGLWLPYTLFWWIPTLTSFEAQTTSFLLRAGLAFALHLTANLLFAAHIRQKTLSPER